MFKSLPAIEKEFDIEMARTSTPGFVRTLLIAFVFVIILGAVWFDWAHAYTQRDVAAALTVAAGQNRHQLIQEFNQALTRSMKNANIVSKKHYGFKTVYKMKLKDGVIYIDLNSEAFKHSKRTKEQQVDFMIDNMTIGAENAMQKLGIKGAHVSIDGKLFKEYKF